MGRPSKAQAWLSEDRLNMIRHWKRNGLTDEEIAKKIGIAPPTFKDWKDRFPTISEAVKKGFDDLLVSAEDALLNKFEIQTLTEEKEEVWQDASGGIKKHKTVTKKQVMPDTAAIIFFLKAKGGWRDNTDLTKSVNSITKERRREIEDAFSVE